MSPDLPHTTHRELPILPPEPTGPTEKFELFHLEEDRTVVDRGVPEFLEDEESEQLSFDAPPVLEEPPAEVTLPRARLPLPPPDRRPREPASRATMPGKRTAVRTPRPPKPPPRRKAPAPPVQGKRRRTPPRRQRRPMDDSATAVSTDPLAPLAAPLVGGRYRIVERVGEGGMGKVFKVTHAQLGKTFALKIITENFASESKARDLFYREARLASSLSHPNIASVVDFGEDEQRGAFMVMEYLEGEPLSKILRRDGPMSLRQALDVMAQAAEAVHYIHSNKIVHCDIKTENMLLCEVPGTKRRVKQLKLLDFGLARSTTASRNTGSLSGTPHYVAPERIRGEQPAPSSDIYGLGILFYELVTGKVPWDGNVAQILAGHLELEPTPPSKLIEGGLDPAAEKLILRALAKDPKDRHKDLSAFIYELRTVMDMLGIGRRQRRGSMRKVVIERPTNQRDAQARTVFDITRVPMAMISKDGKIIVANTAFAKFVMGVAVDVEGLEVSETPLANAWVSFEADLARACEGQPVRRVVEVDIGTDEVRRLMMWLDPGSSEENAVFGVHPLDG
jgi:serine/threonine protein kinase